MGHSKIFQDYLSLCNMVLHANRDVFPYDKIFKAANESIDNDGHRDVTVLDEATHTETLYEVRYGDDGYYATEIRSKISCGGGDCAGCSNNCGEQDSWKITTGYLSHIMEKPDYYIKNPALLDWGWLMAGMF